MSSRPSRPPRRTSSFRRRRAVRKTKCTKNISFDYKKPEELRQYLTSHGRIKPQRLNGLCAKHQRQLTREIKRARQLAFLPFVVE
ncbi:MAG: 30S ribosomal protein S18 [Anaerolineales bacterium]|nr:30S ribosomal protein S18 [Anaerolineales bacterium]